MRLIDTKQISKPGQYVLARFDGDKYWYYNSRVRYYSEVAGMKTISLKLPDVLLMKLEHAAMQQGLSKSQVVRAALERVLNGRQNARKPMSALDLAGDVVGSCKGPGDLSRNPKYMEGFGE
jgi:hypothetical protein